MLSFLDLVRFEMKEEKDKNKNNKKKKKEQREKVDWRVLKLGKPLAESFAPFEKN